MEFTKLYLYEAQEGDAVTSEPKREKQIGKQNDKKQKI